MIDPGQAIIGIIVLLVAVGALLYVFYSRTNAVEKTGYGALIMLAISSLMITIFWILESYNEAIAKSEQHATSVQRDRKSTRLNSSHEIISYAVFCLKKKTNED